MALKSKTKFVCSQCGYESAKWYGQCPGCSSWNSFEEEIVRPSNVSKTSSGSAAVKLTAYKLKNIETDTEIRYKTGLKELDRVLGGGLVKGSLVLLSGDPGIGKSTILLQICQYLGQNLDILYVSGEESAGQIKLRAHRLDVNTDNLEILCDSDMESICEFIRQEKPNLVIIDSIQTVGIQSLSSSTGSVTQVRECTNLLMNTVKALNIPSIIVGHVNKDGNIAGPKVLEHIVDAVLYFEGERHMSYRILRAVKNRYGSTNEIGVFEMTDTGLSDVANELLRLKKERAIEVNINQDNPLIGIGSIGKFLNNNNDKVNITLREAVIRTKEAFGLNIVKVYGDLERTVSEIAVCTGAGKSMIEECIKEKCDLLITGDITYHAALDAVSRGLCIIDASHYGTEIVFVDLIRAFFEMNFSDIKIIPTIQKEVGEFM